MTSLFSELTYSTSLKQLHLCGNTFGINGVRSMVPFLRNAANLSTLHFNSNNNINTECFEILIRGLKRSIKGLHFYNCNITNISALDTYNLPTLQQLNLNCNKIGRDGCITLSNLLQQGSGSTLTHLYLSSAGIGDEEAELLATSLNHNTSLEILYMPNNNITKRGFSAFLKLLVDASSIENTYNSNHTLTSLTFDISTRDETNRHIISALNMNMTYRNSEAAGRAKVITYQLNSQNRKDMCCLQGVEYTSIGNLFADIEPALLPRILALIRRECGQSELYTALIPVVPDLMSCVDTNGMIKDEMVRNSLQMAELTRQLAALSAKNEQLSRRLAAKEDSGDSQQSKEGSTAAGGKRQRS